MNTKRERIGDFRDLLGKLAQVPKAELDREIEKNTTKKAKKKVTERHPPRIASGGDPDCSTSSTAVLVGIPSLYL